MIPNFIAAIGSSLIFLFLFFVLHWHLFVSAGLSIGLFLAIYLLAKPPDRIGNIDVTLMEDGFELKELFEQGKEDIHAIGDIAKNIPQGALKEQILELFDTGTVILEYLRLHPEELSPSRHFFTYYVARSRKIIENYQELKKAHLREARYLEVEEHTIKSLDLLNEVFHRQRDDLYASRIMEVEVESELLEKTVALGEGRDRYGA